MKNQAGFLKICFLFFAVIGMFSGCGRKTLPVPPQGLIPQAIEDLSCTKDASNITLTWTAPHKTTKGERLAEVKTFEVLRARERAASFCEDCPMTFTFLKEVMGGATRKMAKSVKFQYRDADLEPGYYYTYKIRSRNGIFVKSSASNRVTVLWPEP